MKAIIPYLTFEGRTEEAFNFYKSVFGGEFINLNRYNELPNSADLPESEKNLIMHIALKISDDITLMASDSSNMNKKKLVKGNNFQLSINADTLEEAETIFKKLSKHGKIIMPLDKTFWNAYFGILEDQFGIEWMINFDLS